MIRHRRGRCERVDVVRDWIRLRAVHAIVEIENGSGTHAFAHACGAGAGFGRGQIRAEDREGAPIPS